MTMMKVIDDTREDTFDDDIKEDPLHHVSSNVSTTEPSTCTDHNDALPARPMLSSSKEDVLRMLSERHVVQRTPEEDELLDPIERTIRYIVPIPKYYYWDILRTKQEQEQQQQQRDSSTNTEVDSGEPSVVSLTSDDIPYSIKSWHTIIGMCDYFGTWTNRIIAQPIASYIGLTGPRFHEVLNSMTQQERQQSKQIVLERQLRDKIQRQV
jgi:hypothetical protein